MEKLSGVRTSHAQEVLVLRDEVEALKWLLSSAQKWSDDAKYDGDGDNGHFQQL